MLGQLARTRINEALTMAIGGVCFMLLSYFVLPTWKVRRLPYWLWGCLNIGLGAVIMFTAFPYFGLGYVAIAGIRLTIESVGLHPKER